MAWRLARQRANRGAEHPAGPLPYDTTARLVTLLHRMRQDIDLTERDLQRLLEGDPTEPTLMALLQDVLRTVRARLTDADDLTAEWVAMNNKLGK